MDKLPQLIFLTFTLLGSLGLAACANDTVKAGCTYGETCSHYPRDFVILENTEDEPSLYGISWASDSLFANESNVSNRDSFEVFSYIGDSQKEGYKDLWGPSAISYAATTSAPSEGFFYVTAALENTLAVLNGSFFQNFSSLKYNETRCTSSPTQCDEACQRACYQEALSSTLPASRVLRRDDFGHSYEVPVDTLLSHPAGLDTWSRASSVILFVASRDGGQVSVFEHSLISTDASTESQVTYLRGIDTERPRRVLVLDPDPDDDEVQLIVLGTSETDDCPDSAALAAGTVASADLREDFLSIYTITITNGVVTPRKVTELRSGSCFGTLNCKTDSGLRGIRDIHIEAGATDRLFMSNRCTNTIHERSLDFGATSSGVTTLSVGETIQRVYTVSDTGVFEGCEERPANLGFKGLTVSADYLYVASWETGYILEWERDNETTLTKPKATCALAAERCALRTCTEVNPNWYLRNDQTAHFYRDGTNQQNTMRPFPYAMKISGTGLYVSLDRNGQLAKCTIAEPAEEEASETDAAETMTESSENLGLEVAASLVDCQVLE